MAASNTRRWARSHLALTALTICADGQRRVRRRRPEAHRGTISTPRRRRCPGSLSRCATRTRTRVLTTVTNNEGAYVLPVRADRPLHADRRAAADSRPPSGKDIEVRVGDRLRFDLALQVGAVTEEVTVRSEAPLLDTSNAIARPGDQPRAGRRTCRSSAAIPSRSRSSRPACSTRPRLASRSNRPFDNGGMDNFQISGGRGFTNEFLLDGVPNTGTRDDPAEQPELRAVAGRDRGVQGPDQHLRRAVRPHRRRRRQRRAQERHQPVPRRRSTSTTGTKQLNANTFDANRSGTAEGRPLLEPARPHASTGPCAFPASTTARTRRSSCTTGSRSAARCRSRRSTRCRARSSAPATSRRRAPPTAGP